MVPPDARSDRRRLLGACLVCALMLAACGGDDGAAPAGGADGAAERTEDAIDEDTRDAFDGGSEAAPDTPPMADAAAEAPPGASDSDVVHDAADSADAGDSAETGDAPSGDAAGRDAPPAMDVRMSDVGDAGSSNDANDASTVDSQHVHVSISNTCVVGASPSQFTVAAGRTLRLSWHNHSVDYDADVWLSYGGGFLGLKTGEIWDDRFEFCAGPGSYMAYGDVSIAGGGGSVCPSFRVWINCQ